MSEHILLVDPETQRRASWRRRLAGQGYQVSTASSLESAPDAVAGAPQVVVLDLTLLCAADGPSVDRLLQVASASHGVYCCPHCGRHVAEIAPGAGRPECCGAPMDRVGSSGSGANADQGLSLGGGLAG